MLVSAGLQAGASWASHPSTTGPGWAGPAAKIPQKRHSPNGQRKGGVKTRQKRGYFPLLEQRVPG